MSELEKKIYEYACQGYGNASIAKTLDISPDDIYTFLKNLELEKKLKVDFARQKRKEAERELELEKINQVVSRVIDGFSFLEIAIQLEIPEQEVKDRVDRLKNTITFKNVELYEEVWKKERALNNSEYILMKRLEGLDPLGEKIYKWGTKQSQEKWKKYLNVKKLFILLKQKDYQMNKSDMTMKTGLSTKTINQILEGTAYQELRDEILGPNSYNEIKEKTYSYIQKESKKRTWNTSYPKKNATILNKWKKEIKLWVKIMFTFEISLEQLQALLLSYSGINLPLEILESTLKEFLKSSSYQLEKAYSFLKEQNSLRSVTEKGINYQKAEEFLIARKYQMSASYHEKYQSLLKEMYDVEVLDLLNKKKPRDYTDSDWEKIVRFRIKYALSYRELPFRKETYQNHIPKHLEEQNERVSDFNKRISTKYYLNLQNQQKILERYQRETEESIKISGGNR